MPGLGIKTPQARKRKVALIDLMSALEKALKVNHRRIMKHRFYADIQAPKIPDRKINMSELITNMLDKVKQTFIRDKSVTFTSLLSEKPDKQEKIFTFIPLLHLDNKQKIDMKQEKPFDEIHIHINE